MSSRRENALIVNALQRCASVVVQNSLREGFGLTATEAMWKRVGVVGTRACGLRQQIEHDVEGLLVENPGDPAEIAGHIESLLVDDGERRRLGRAAQRRVHRDFLIFTQLRQWLRLLESVVDAPAA
jgi:trehalose synthase